MIGVIWLTVSREAEHPSQRDPKTRFSVFELDKNDKVLAVRHMYP